MVPESILKLSGVNLTRNGKHLVRDLNFEVFSNQNWVILGPNGSGKTSLLRIASMFEHPSSGSVTLLEHTLGTSDMRKIRHMVGFTGHGITIASPRIKTEDVVMTAKHGPLNLGGIPIQVKIN